MTFSDFSKYLQKLESTPSRLNMTAILAELFCQLKNEEIPPVCYMMQGKLVPAYQSLEFQLSTKMVIRSLSRIVKDNQTNQSEQTNLFGENDEEKINELTKQYKKIGDIGEFTSSILSANNDHQPYSIVEVFNKLKQIAEYGGEGSQEEKVVHLSQLLSDVDPLSAKYIARIVVGKLRLGFATMTMLDALSWSKYGDKRDTAGLEEYYQKKADIGLLAQTYLSAQVNQPLDQTLKDYSAEINIPIIPALCQRLNSSEEIIEKMGTVMAEPKYDGLRVQIHIDKKCHSELVSESMTSKLGSRNKFGMTTLRVFTRNLEDVSHMFPELPLALKFIKADNVVLDAEAVGYDKSTNQLVTFQQTSTRRRKHDIDQKADEVPLKFFVFDVLYYNNQPTIDTPLRDRKDLLAKLILPNSTLIPTKFLITESPTDLRRFHEEQLALGLEGAVIKQIDSQYRPGRKGWNWVKIKESEGTSGKLKDTLDCIIMGYYLGRGKRAQFGIGAILVGITGKRENGKAGSDSQVLTIAKIGTGISEEILTELKKRLEIIKVTHQPPAYEVNKLLIPDVWVESKLVVEIAADELTKSPTHSAGVALRFPRLIKIRDDKGVEDATQYNELSSL